MWWLLIRIELKLFFFLFIDLLMMVYKNWCIWFLGLNYWKFELVNNKMISDKNECFMVVNESLGKECRLKYRRFNI